jgi:capsular polysaccharide transport system permease protein
MTDAKLNYIGPNPKLIGSRQQTIPWWKKLPLGFLVVVALPTLIAAFYYLLIASPRYVSEARFIVRAPNHSQPSSLGIALQTAGLSPAMTDSYAVHEYIDSRDSLRDLGRTMDLAATLAPPGSDFLSRFPRPWEKQTEEGLYKGFKRFVTVGYDGTTGISTLRVKGFTPRDAQRVGETLLTGGEKLVNRLNERSSADAVAQATIARDLAQTKLAKTQADMTNFRNREQFINPTITASEGGQLIGGLLSTIANLKAERAQIASEAPRSPQLPILDSRIRAYESQVAAERAKMSGSEGSLSSKIGAYEDLVLARELADRELAQATAALVSAEQEARSQKLYLEQIVSPSLPDSATEPRRLRGILTVLFSCLIAYGVGWLIYAGVREHRQA